MNHIVLIGDSIFDNASYVDEEESVIEVLRKSLSTEAKTSLLAVDGDVTTDIPQQLRLFPSNATHTFVSCGGNDALRIVNVLEKSVSTVGDAMSILSSVRKQFRINYSMMLQAIVGKTDNLTVCTIYNTIPSTREPVLSALALFNEIILQEAVALNLSIIDLRLVFTDEADYSTMSSIEPSGRGSIKIVNSINKVVNTHDYTRKISSVYV